MLDLDYNNWKTICENIFKLKNDKCLQTYPYSILSLEDKEFIASKDFFNNYIKTGFFLFMDDNWIKSRCYMPKPDGNFRNATIISPIFYLFFQSFTKNISNLINLKRNENLEVYYAGNFTDDKLTYKKEYDNFYKSINIYNDEFTYCIKTDIKDFFPSINMNILFDKIDKNINSENIVIPNKDLMFYKCFINFIGNNKFPIIKNCTATSYLATSVFLNDVDISICNFMSNNYNIFNYKLIRYVDDLYIFFNLKKETDNINQYKNLILNRLTSELNNIGLHLNLEKTKLIDNQTVDDELKRSLYDDIVNGHDFNIDDYYNVDKLVAFIKKFNEKTQNFNIDFKGYEELINKNFYIEGITYSPRDIFNNLIYEDNSIIKDERIIDLLFEIFNISYDLLKLDSNKLMVLILNTKSERLIKHLLSKIFEKSRNDNIDMYDITIILTYLVNRNFKHNELLKIVKNMDYKTFDYIEKFCKKSFLQISNQYEGVKFKFLNEIYFKSNDKILFYLYSFYMFELNNNNYLGSFAYFKNFFDRITADIDFKVNTKIQKNPNYNRFYTEKALQKFYSNEKTLIKLAHNIRNSNPLSHSSSELLKDESAKNNILKIIDKLKNLILQTINNV